MEEEWLFLARLFLNAPNKWACSQGNQLEDRQIKNKTKGANICGNKKQATLNKFLQKYTLKYTLPLD